MALVILSQPLGGAVLAAARRQHLLMFSARQTALELVKTHITLEFWSQPLRRAVLPAARRQQALLAHARKHAAGVRRGGEETGKRGVALRLLRVRRHHTPVMMLGKMLNM